MITGLQRHLDGFDYIILEQRRDGKTQIAIATYLGYSQSWVSLRVARLKQFGLLNDIGSVTKKGLEALANRFKDEKPTEEKPYIKHEGGDSVLKSPSENIELNITSADTVQSSDETGVLHGSPWDYSNGHLTLKGELRLREYTEEVEHPTHYGGDTFYEPIKVIAAWDLNFNLGSAVKYISRAGKKGPALTDLKKAVFCLQQEIKKLEESE